MNIKWIGYVEKDHFFVGSFDLDKNKQARDDLDIVDALKKSAKWTNIHYVELNYVFIGSETSEMEAYIDKTPGKKKNEAVWGVNLREVVSTKEEAVQRLLKKKGLFFKLLFERPWSWKK